MDLNFAIIQKMSVIHKTIYKGPLKCWNVVITLPCGTNFNGVELCLNNPKPKKCTLLCQHLYLSLQGGRKPVPSCSHIQLPNWVFKSLGWMYLGQKQSSKLNQGFIHRVASIRIFLMWSGIFPVAMQCKLAREKRSLKKKKKEMAPRQVFIEWKIGAPERNKCLELLTLLPYHIPTQSDGHTLLCQNMPCYWAWRQVSSLRGYGIMCWGFIWVHMKESLFLFVCLYLMLKFLMPPFLPFSCPAPLLDLFPTGIFNFVLKWF